jgi:hypothetical protein
VSTGASRSKFHVAKTVRFIPDLKSSGNRLVVVLAGHPIVCLGPPCKVLNQLVVGLSSLSETTHSTGHEIPNDGS